MIARKSRTNNLTVKCFPLSIEICRVPKWTKEKPENARSDFS
jgi:hypothetical protein